MKKFYETDRGLYTVENVFVRHGKLVTGTGTELKPTDAFQPGADETAGGQVANERLMRRGQ